MALQDEDVSSVRRGRVPKPRASGRRHRLASQALRCTECSGRLREGCEDFDYGTMSGGLAITLRDCTVDRCADCGEWEVGFWRVLDLHRLIASSYVRKPGRLAPAEARFLRKFLNWSAADFAANMGVTTTQVSRWENGMAMSATAERLLRVLASTHDMEGKAKRVTMEELQVLLARKSGPVRPLRMVLRVKRGRWVREDAG